jgi:hypothetical protein
MRPMSVIVYGDDARTSFWFSLLFLFSRTLFAMFAFLISFGAGGWRRRGVIHRCVQTQAAAAAAMTKI